MVYVVQLLDPLMKAVETTGVFSTLGKAQASVPTEGTWEELAGGRAWRQSSSIAEGVWPLETWIFEYELDTPRGER